MCQRRTAIAYCRTCPRCVVLFGRRLADNQRIDELSRDRSGLAEASSRKSIAEITGLEWKMSSKRWQPTSFLVSLAFFGIARWPNAGQRPDHKAADSRPRRSVFRKSQAV